MRNYITLILITLVLSWAAFAQPAGDAAQRRQQAKALSSKAVHMDAAKNDEAIELFSQAIKIDPAHIESYVGRGLIYLGKAQANPKDVAAKDWNRKALADFDAAISNGSKYGQDYYLRALALTRLDQRDRALADLRECLKLQPDYPGAANLLSFLGGEINPKPVNLTAAAAANAITGEWKGKMVFDSKQIELNLKGAKTGNALTAVIIGGTAPGLWEAKTDSFSVAANKTVSFIFNDKYRVYTFTGKFESDNVIAGVFDTKPKATGDATKGWWVLSKQ